MLNKQRPHLGGEKKHNLIEPMTYCCAWKEEKDFVSNS